MFGGVILIPVLNPDLTDGRQELFLVHVEIVQNGFEVDVFFDFLFLMAVSGRYFDISVVSLQDFRVSHKTVAGAEGQCTSSEGEGRVLLVTAEDCSVIIVVSHVCVFLFHSLQPLRFLLIWGISSPHSLYTG